MGGYIWIALGLTIFFLFLPDDFDEYVPFVISFLWAGIVGSWVLQSNRNTLKTTMQFFVWAGIFMGFMALYVFRYDLQDLASRLSGGLVAGSPISTTNKDGGLEVTLVRSPNDHFEAKAEVNGKTVWFLVDTGATAIVLTAKDAKAAGIDLSKLSFTAPSQTANGVAYSAITKVKTLQLGDIERQNLSVMVSKPGRLFQSLLGQQFLESLSSYEKRGDRLTLRD